MNNHPTIFAILSVLTLALAVGCRPETSAEAPPPEMLKVGTISPEVREIRDMRTFVGTVKAVETVDIQAQVTGQLMEMCFTPGERVERGTVLFKIDPRMYQATLDAATAQLAVLEAELPSLLAEFDRAKELQPAGALSEGDFEQAEADYQKCQAQIAAAKASIDSAKINLGYTEVVAPLAGEVSRELVSVGNVVNANSTTLAKMISIDPIHIYFDIDEASFLQTQQLERCCDVVFEIGGDPRQYVAAVEYSDPYLNPSSGTRMLRAETPNPPVFQTADGHLTPREANLLPGMMIRVHLPVSEEYTAVVIPEFAIMSDQDRKFVYTVDDQNKIVITFVELGPLQRDNMRVVTSGLDRTTRVLIDSLLKVRPGMEVAPVQKGDPAPASEPAPAPASPEKETE